MAGELGTLDKKAAEQATPTALDKLAGGEGVIVAAGVPEGYDAFLLAAIPLRFSAHTAFQQAVLHIARDDHRLAAIRSRSTFSRQTPR